MKGIIFDIKEFAVHDGPGSRITVFLKGCPLRCRWCHNPEGFKAERQLMYKSTLCTHCGRCRVPCDHAECRAFGRCIHVCPNGCLSIAGQETDSEALAEKLLRNAGILDMLGGGITISGGEPMMQADFVCDLAGRLGPVHKAIQTSGYTDLSTYRRVINTMDYVMQDIKLADPGEHRRYTGVDNECILENIEWLKESKKEFVFRVPLIPGITDTEQNLKAIAKITGDFRTELMMYNPFAGAKYPMIGMQYPITNEKNAKEDYTQYFSNAVMVR